MTRSKTSLLMKSMIKLHTINYFYVLILKILCTFKIKSRDIKKIMAIIAAMFKPWFNFYSLCSFQVICSQDIIWENLLSRTPSVFDLAKYLNIQYWKQFLNCHLMGSGMLYQCGVYSTIPTTESFELIRTCLYITWNIRRSPKETIIKWVPENMYTFSIAAHIVNVYKFSGTHFILYQYCIFVYAFSLIKHKLKDRMLQSHQ